MGLIIVAGGQYGSEGKGKVAAYMAKDQNASAIVKVGGTNSGHTIIVKGKEHKLRMLPAAALTGDYKIIFPAGSYIDWDILQQEVEAHGIDNGRILIDQNAAIIRRDDSYNEKSNHLDTYISSTCSGTGSAVIHRTERLDEYAIAKYFVPAKDYIFDTKEFICDLCDKGRSVVVEGTQGYMLSILHTPYYPYCTARDTSAAGILSEVGCSPRHVEKIVTVFRSYPIRVAGNSGPLPYECSWADVTTGSESKNKIREYTTVTNKIRRIAEFDFNAAAMVVRNERPDIIVMNHMDYIDAQYAGKNILTDRQEEFLDKVEKRIGFRICLYGTSPDSIHERTHWK